MPDVKDVEIIMPKDEKHWLELRKQDITSTEISALFGISPYITKFELWHRKKNQVDVDFEVSDRMKWGTRLQDTIAAGIAEDEKWKVRRMEEYIRNPKFRLGASFDFAIEEEIKGLLEIKNVDSLIFKQGWEIAEDGSVEAPPHIELQVQQQLLVSQRSFCYIGALVGGNRITLLKREPDAEIFEAIKTTVVEFWESIEVGEAPSPDFEKDADFISKLYAYSSPGKIIDLTDDIEVETLAKRHRELTAAIKQCSVEKDAIKAQLLTRISDAEKVICNGFTISAGLIGPAEISYTREGYRMFKLNFPRGKKKV